MGLAIPEVATDGEVWNEYRCESRKHRPRPTFQPQRGGWPRQQQRHKRGGLQYVMFQPLGWHLVVAASAGDTLAALLCQLPYQSMTAALIAASIICKGSEKVPGERNI